jgi:hypothetical protein
MAEEEVMELTVRVDVDAVRAYRDAVGRKAITHNAVHLGEAATIRSLAGFNIGI